MLVYWMVSYQSLKTSPILVWPRGPQPVDFWRKQVDCFKSEGAKAWVQIPVTGWSVEYWLMHFVTNAKRKLSPIIVTIAIIFVQCPSFLFTSPKGSQLPPSMAAAAGCWAPGARQGIGGSGRTVVVLLAVVEVLAGDGWDSLTRKRWRFG
jgi:hypothetical protein